LNKEPTKKITLQRVKNKLPAGFRNWQSKTQEAPTAPYIVIAIFSTHLELELTSYSSICEIPVPIHECILLLEESTVPNQD
jgi:hypothetical protein